MSADCGIVPLPNMSYSLTRLNPCSYRGGLTGSDICKLYYDPMTRKQYDLDDWLSQQKTNF